MYYTESLFNKDWKTNIDTTKVLNFELLALMLNCWNAEIDAEVANEIKLNQKMNRILCEDCTQS